MFFLMRTTPGRTRFVRAFRANSPNAPISFIHLIQAGSLLYRYVNCGKRKRCYRREQVHRLAGMQRGSAQ